MTCEGSSESARQAEPALAQIAQLHGKAARRPTLEFGRDGHDDRITLIKLPERELVVDI
jgi:hypothetical protein